MTTYEMNPRTRGNRFSDLENVLATQRESVAQKREHQRSPVARAGRPQSSAVSGWRQLASLEGKVVGAVPGSDLTGAIAALAAAGFPASQIQILTRDDLADFLNRLSRPGLTGVFRRLLLRNTLFDLQQASDELLAGDDLLLIPVPGDDAARRVAAIMHQHGGYGMKHFGRWLVVVLE